MRKYLTLFAVMAVGVWGVSGNAVATEHHHKPVCEPGYKIVEEVCYKEVVTKVCKVVPEVKKKVKWVYDCVSEDFCLPKCACPLHGLTHRHGCEKCQACMECGKVRTKNLLVKKQVIEECPTTKCVVETVVEKVPYIVYRKVPCDSAVPAPVLPPGVIKPGVIPEPIPAPKGPYMPPAASQIKPGIPSWAGPAAPLPAGKEAIAAPVNTSVENSAPVIAPPLEFAPLPK